MSPRRYLLALEREINYADNRQQCSLSSRDCGIAFYAKEGEHESPGKSKSSQLHRARRKTTVFMFALTYICRTITSVIRVRESEAFLPRPIAILPRSREPSASQPLPANPQKANLLPLFTLSHSTTLSLSNRRTIVRF